MAEVLDQPQALPQPKPKKIPPAAFLAHCWTTESARAGQLKARQVREANKARIQALADGVINPQAILAEEIKVIRDKLRRARDPGAIKTLWSVLKDMLKASEPDQPKPEPSQTGPIKPLV